MTIAPDSRQPVHTTVKKMLLTGIFFLFPIGVTFWLLNLLISKTQGIARPWVEQAISTFGPMSQNIHNIVVTVVSLFLVIFFVLLIGWLANIYIGKKFLGLVDTLMLKVPFIRSIYGGTKQIIDAFSIQRSSGSFKKVVMLEYPKKDCWVLGFVTNEKIEDAQGLLGQPLAAVFVPSTPNPTTGFLLYLDPEALFLIDLEVEEAVKLIVSAGLVLPSGLRKKPITLAENMGLAATEEAAIAP